MSLSNEVSIGICTDEDIPSAFVAMSNGFGHDAPFFDAYFPGHDTASGQAQATKRLTKLKHSEADSSFVKATMRTDDGRSERIVGFALWTHMKEAQPRELRKVEDVDATWTDKDDREYMECIWRDFVVPRGQVIQQSNGAGVYGELNSNQERKQQNNNLTM